MTSTKPDSTWTARIGYDRLFDFVTAIDALTNECKLAIEEDGMSTSAVDPANVAMVRANLPADAFEEFDVDATETEIGVNARRVRKVLEHLEQQDTVSITLQQDRKKLTFSGGPYSYTYAHLSADTVRSEATIPDMDLSATVDIDSDRLTTAVAYFREFSEHVTVGYDLSANEFYMEAVENGGTDDGEFRLQRSDLEYVPHPGEANSLFSTDYFVDLTEALPEGGTVTLEIGECEPMTMSYGIAPVDGPGDRYHGEVTFFQAPRIQSD